MDKTALFQITYGIYVVSSKKDECYNGCIVNSIFQVTAEPPTIAISVNKNNLTHEFISKSGKFVISILSEEAPLKFIGNFGFKSGSDINKFENVNFKLGVTEIPIVLDYTLAYIELNLINSIDVGTHTIFIGEVLDAENLNKGNPLTYSFYRAVKNGKSPKNAPTYIFDSNKNSNDIKKGKKYRCKVCGFIYSEENGDPTNNIPAGTKFEEIPDSWKCPICGVGKEEFELVVEER